MQCTGEETSPSGSSGIFGWQRPVNQLKHHPGETLRKPGKSPAVKPSVNTHRHFLRTLAILNGTCVASGMYVSIQGKKEVGKQGVQISQSERGGNPCCAQPKRFLSG